jgi:hypothetical protein
MMLVVVVPVPLGGVLVLLGVVPALLLVGGVLLVVVDPVPRPSDPLPLFGLLLTVLELRVPKEAPLPLVLGVATTLPVGFVWPGPAEVALAVPAVRAFVPATPLTVEVPPARVELAPVS